MVSQCANPECNTPFLYLRGGKLFARHNAQQQDGSRVEYFWLCGDCAEHLHMETALDGAMNLVPRPVPAGQKAREEEMR